METSHQTSSGRRPGEQEVDMAARSEMLDQALSIGRRELGCLTEGDVFEAEKLARDRERIIDEAIADLDGILLEKLADKLVEVKNLHDEITDEARKLHSSLKHDLANIKKQNNRISGYSYGAGNMPSMNRERFIHKKG